MSSTTTLPRPTSKESRAEVTDRIAREMIEAETARRQQQTARLRSARLKREAVQSPAAPAAPVKKPRKAAR